MIMGRVRANGETQAQPMLHFQFRKHRFSGERVCPLFFHPALVTFTQYSTAVYTHVRVYNRAILVDFYLLHGS